MPKPCLVIVPGPINRTYVPVTALCGKRFETGYELVPAFDEGILPNVKTGAFHAKCETEFLSLKASGEVLIYAVRAGKEE